MDLRIVESYEKMSENAAEFIIYRVRNYPTIKLGLATGNTPEGTYQYLIHNHQVHETSYRGVTTFNLDEYIGVSDSHPNSYHYYMCEHLFSHIDIDLTNTFIPCGDAENNMLECKRYEDLIKSKGGIDLQILGIGENGHIGFNEPNTSFDSKTHVVSLTESTRKANARYFSNINEVPNLAITMGIGTIMQSKEILLLISGDTKKGALHRLLQGVVDASFPASILMQHPNVTIIADEAAASDIR